MLSNIEPVDSAIPGAVVYYYDNPADAADEPSTGWYWGQGSAGYVDSYDERAYPSRNEAAEAASSYDPTPLRHEDLWA